MICAINFTYIFKLADLIWVSLSCSSLGFVDHLPVAEFLEGVGNVHISIPSASGLELWVMVERFSLTKLIRITNFACSLSLIYIFIYVYIIIYITNMNIILYITFINI